MRSPLRLDFRSHGCKKNFPISLFISIRSGIAFRVRVWGMANHPPVVLTIAGFDPSSGAGITADIKTIAAHECFGLSCITALTVQSTQGVRRVQGIDPEIILETLEELVADFSINAVHIGMLGNERVASTVADFLGRHREKLPHIVLDPILKSSSGADLLGEEGAQVLVKRLLPLAELLTPNLEEASVLTGMKVTNLDEMRDAAAYLHTLGAANVVVTGGHLEEASDLLSMRTTSGNEQEVFRAERQRSDSTHGTGCAFATALACNLAHGRGLAEAVQLSKAYISAAIANAYPVGHGIGPMHHLYRFGQRHIRITK